MLFSLYIFVAFRYLFLSFSHGAQARVQKSVRVGISIKLFSVHSRPIPCPIEQTHHTVAAIEARLSFGVMAVIAVNTNDKHGSAYPFCLTGQQCYIYFGSSSCFLLLYQIGRRQKAIIYVYHSPQFT